MRYILSMKNGVPLSSVIDRVKRNTAQVVSVQLLINTAVVEATPDQASALKAIEGVHLVPAAMASSPSVSSHTKVF